MFTRNKKGQSFLESTLGRIILALVAFAIIAGLIKVLLFQADDKLAEETCQKFNLLRAKEAAAGRDIRIIPCKVIEKGDIPSGKYSQNTEGVKKQIADLAARCWWMWAQGEKDIELLKDLNLVPPSNQKCFICYTFRIDKVKDFTPFTPAELKKYFADTFHSVKDEGDRCALNGGICVDEEATCPDPSMKPRQSKNCQLGQVCCTGNNECVNRGGECISDSEVQQEGWVENTKWICSGGDTCYVDRKSVMSYRDYIQHSGGAGQLDVGQIDTFQAEKEVYAVMFREDIKYTSEVEVDGIVIDKLKNSLQCGQVVEGLKG